MNAKKFTLVTFISIIIFVIFAAVSTYYTNSWLDADYDRKMQEIDDFVNDNSGNDDNNSGTNPGVDPSIPSEVDGKTIFTSFYDIMDSAIDYTKTAKGYAMEILQGNGAVTAKINAHVPGNPTFNVKSNIVISKVKDSTGKKIFNFMQYGETPPELEGIYTNGYFTRTVTSGQSYYFFETKDPDELNNIKSSQWTMYSRSSFLDKAGCDIDEFMYIINEDTVESIDYFNIPVKDGKLVAGGKYTAKVRLKKSAAEKYNKMIAFAAGFITCDTSNIVLQITFDQNGHFVSMACAENMLVDYETMPIPVLGTKVRCDVQIANNYVMYFSDYNGKITQQVK